MSDLALVERFVSVQGEGRNAGRLAAFIRFAGCNLDCQFGKDSVCDTPWRHANEKVSVDDVVSWAYTATNLGEFIHLQAELRPMVIITGGEPTIAPGFEDLAIALESFGFYVAVETNGTTWNEGLRCCRWVVVSPKDQVRQHKGDPTVNPQVIAHANEFRYVIGPDSFGPPFVDTGAVHYLSPAMMADGLGTEHTDPVPPTWVPGAMERCLDIVTRNPRFRLSLQTHKWVGVR